MQQTKTAITEHGSVEYEVTKCSSCGQEITVNGAKDMLVADEIDEHRNYTHYDHVKLKAYGESQSGKICDYCANGEVSGVPSSSSHINSAKGIPRKILALLITIALLPREPVKEELANQGLDDFNADIGSQFVTGVWILVIIPQMLISAGMFLL